MNLEEAPAFGVLSRCIVPVPVRRGHGESRQQRHQSLERTHDLQCVTAKEKETVFSAHTDSLTLCLPLVLFSLFRLSLSRDDRRLVLSCDGTREEQAVAGMGRGDVRLC